MDFGKIKRDDIDPLKMNLTHSFQAFLPFNL